MVVYKHKQQQNFKWLRPVLYITVKIIVALVLLHLFSKYKPLILIVVFEFLDITKLLLQKTLPFIPFDLVFIFGVTASFFYSPAVSMIIFGLSLLNRIVLMSIEPRHISKAIRHFLFFLLVPFFRNLDFFLVATAALTLNYLLKYALNIARSSYENFDKFYYHAINYFFSLIIFYFISVVFKYFPVLS